jgi:hypothetical protein
MNRYYFGDRAEYRNNYLFSDHWKKLRKEKLAKNPTCEKCGSNLCVEPYHLQYKNLYNTTVEDLQTLCRKCHVHAHNESNKQSKYKKRIDFKNPFRNKRALVKKMNKLGIASEVAEFYIEKLSKEAKTNL